MEQVRSGDEADKGTGGMEVGRGWLVDEPTWNYWRNVDFALVTLCAWWWGWGMSQRVRFEERANIVPMPVKVS